MTTKNKTISIVLKYVSYCIRHQVHQYNTAIAILMLAGLRLKAKLCKVMRKPWLLVIRPTTGNKSSAA